MYIHLYIYIYIRNINSSPVNSSCQHFDLAELTCPSPGLSQLCFPPLWMFNCYVSLIIFPELMNIVVQQWTSNVPLEQVFKNETISFFPDFFPSTCLPQNNPARDEAKFSGHTALAHHLSDYSSANVHYPWMVVWGILFFFGTYPCVPQQCWINPKVCQSSCSSSFA